MVDEISLTGQAVDFRTKLSQFTRMPSVLAKNETQLSVLTVTRGPRIFMQTSGMHGTQNMTNSSKAYARFLPIYACNRLVM